MRKFPIKPNTTCQYQHTFSSNKKRGNKKGNSCYCLNYLEKKGNIQLILKDGNPNIFISKLTLVDFDDNFDNLLEKGKVVDARSIKDENFASSIDKNYFGYYEQRYYFYEKYDLGIKMDKESKKLFLLL